MKNPRLAALLKRAMEKTITPSERNELLALMADDTNKADVEQALEHLWEKFETRDTVLTSDRGADILNRIFEPNQPRIPNQKFIHRLVRPWLRIAALIALVTAIGLYFYRWSAGESLPAELTLAEAAEQYDIKPGSDNKAILTLGDGRVVVLDDIHNGLVAEDAGASILKSDDGQLRYDQNGKTPVALTYNTIHIPRGGRFRLVLPDGSHVQLNADSYIRFPTRFMGDRREVELSGEAYFEIAHDGDRPFFVKTPYQVTKVLGTIFNVSAYADETATKTTLVAGSVEVSGSHGQPVILKPGQAAVNNEGRSELTIMRADLDRELAWQKGYFVFNNEHIKNIMQRISRWYDVEVEYEGNLEHKYFGGIFQQSKSIAQLLDSFKETGIIDFKIIERRVIVIGK